MQMSNWQKSANRRLFSFEERPKMGRIDWLVMAAVTLLYALVAFTNLGSSDIPKTYYAMTEPGDEIVVEFTQPETIDSIRYFTSLGGGSFSFSYSMDGEGYTDVLTKKTVTDAEGNETESFSPLSVNHDPINMYEWEFVTCEEFTAKYVAIHVDLSGARILEMGFCGADANPVPIAKSENTNPEAPRGNPVSNMFDEQDHVPQRTYYMTEMYFDEVYHARTAYEFITHMSIYEWTHPPLGKVLLSTGISIFGMNPFGWRFMGTLFGVMMLPLMYVFAKRLFGKTLFAFIPTVLFALDFMHYSQTRLATIDSYSVFFVMLMFFFMYLYTERSYNRESLLSTLMPLALSGLFFGIGAATKWLCIYAGAGLFLLLFIQLGKRFLEYVHVCRSLEDEEQLALMDERKRLYFERIRDTYIKNTFITLLWCVMFFVVIPLGIYYIAYSPYMAAPVDSAGVALRVFFMVFVAAVIALLFALRLIRLRREQKAPATQGVSDNMEANTSSPAAYRRKTIFTVVACLIVIAAALLFVHYISFTLYTADDQHPFNFATVLKNQDDMFNYHSDLDTTDNPHPFASKWYTWPIDFRPLFLFQGQGYPQEYMSSMSTMGNPAVWWGGLASVIALVVIRIRKGRLGRRTMFLGIAAASQFIPWAIITRETFIYHYFETVPFMILLMGVLAKYMIERTKHGKKAVFIFLAFCLLLFILFYPVTTGIVIPRWYAYIIRWSPLWPFY